MTAQSHTAKAVQYEEVTEKQQEARQIEITNAVFLELS
jgi:hypothetical protein